MAAGASAVTLRGGGGTFFGAAAAAASAAAPDAEAVLAYRAGAAPRHAEPRRRASRRVRRHASAAAEDDIGSASGGDQAREGREDCGTREVGGGGGGDATEAEPGPGRRGEQAEVAGGGRGLKRARNRDTACLCLGPVCHGLTQICECASFRPNSNFSPYREGCNSNFVSGPCAVAYILRTASSSTAGGGGLSPDILHSFLPCPSRALCLSLWGPATIGGRPTPGAQISILGTFAADEHQQVPPPLVFRFCRAKRSTQTLAICIRRI